MSSDRKTVDFEGLSDQILGWDDSLAWRKKSFGAKVRALIEYAILCKAEAAITVNEIDVSDSALDVIGEYLDAKFADMQKQLLCEMKTIGIHSEPRGMGFVIPDNKMVEIPGSSR